MSTSPEGKTDARAFSTCPLCEATCGLEFALKDGTVQSVRGDVQDVFSSGYLCPKGASLKDLHDDPDRLRVPLIRVGEQWREASWEEAFSFAGDGLLRVIETHGRDAVGVYLGNPNVHTLAGQLYVPALLRALGSRNRFSSSTVDQMPKQVASGLLYGSGFSIPVPDVDRTDLFVILGANPLVSNGSLLTAPNMRDRMRAMQARGGKIVVIDPVRTWTAKCADEHYFIRPGTDVLLLLAMVYTLFEEQLTGLAALAPHVNGVLSVREVVRDWSPERVSPACGLDADLIRNLARELAKAKRAVVYGRMGTCTQKFGTLTSWLIDVVNVLTGHLDSPGGALFPLPAAGAKNVGGGRGLQVKFGRFHSRVRHLPEVFGELPVACLLEEMETPGDGQLRGFITIAGNPVLSTPGGDRLDGALASLEFMVSIDCYLNETTRRANVILPPPSPLESSHYDLTLYHLAVRNIAHYSPPVLPVPEGRPEEWEIILRLAAAVSLDRTATVQSLDDATLSSLVTAEVTDAHSPLANRDPQDLVGALSAVRGPERILDWLLRSGRYGDHFGASPNGLHLTALMAHPHGMDLGPLKPRIPEVLRTPSGKVELAPDVLIDQVKALSLDDFNPPSVLVLVGRRDLLSNNSWLHNLAPLMKKGDRCQLWMHSEDAATLDIQTGDQVEVRTTQGCVTVLATVTNDVMPGTVSLPHGWGHVYNDTRLHIASSHHGVNINVLTDDGALDPVSGNAVLQGVAVSVRKVQGIGV